MRSFRRNCSGQVLVLAALAIALIISSTMVYVFQMAEAQSLGHPSSSDDYVRTVKLSTRNLVIGSLADISYGGNTTTLGTNLERWCSFVENQYYLGKSHVSFALCERSPYSSGLRLFWGTAGFGVTSAKVDFSMGLTDETTEMSAVYSVNVTTSIYVSGVHQEYSPNWYAVNVTIHVNNEWEPALAKNFTVYHESETGWQNSGLLSGYYSEDFGNGTYRASFVCQNFVNDVSVRLYDWREIFVQANATCA